MLCLKYFVLLVGNKGQNIDINEIELNKIYYGRLKWQIDVYI